MLRTPSCFELQRPHATVYENTISASHVQDLISNIAGIGFSSAVSRCTGIEVHVPSSGIIDLCVMSLQTMKTFAEYVKQDITVA